MSDPKFDNFNAARPLDQKTQGNGPSSYLDYLELQKQMGNQNAASAFLTEDDKMQQIREIIQQIANASVSVLISGESGVGKEVVARNIHECSDRRDKPFIAINCAALPPNLLESELFGFEKGSFTGANQQHIGKFEQASGGTLLLDEITEMDINLQAKLLRALQEKEIQRIGGKDVISINTRIIATTNTNISQAVASGKFRQDLYYRLHVIPLNIPPLRERPKDIKLLASHFLGRFARDYRKGELEFTDNAMRKLLSYSWPGNIRELQNIIQRSVLMTTNSFVDDRDIPIDTNSTVKNRDWISALPIGTPLRDLETHFILETLKSHVGNRTHAAKTLGISLRTLRNKINEYTAAGYIVQAPANGKAA